MNIYKNIIDVFSNWNERKDDYPGALFISIYEKPGSSYRINFNDDRNISYKIPEEEYCVKYKIDVDKLIGNIRKNCEIDHNILIFNYSINEYFVCSLDEKNTFMMILTVSAGNTTIRDFIEIYSDNIEKTFNYIKDWFIIREKDNEYEFGIAAIDVSGALYTSYYDYKYKEIDIEKNYNDDIPYDNICKIINKESPELMLFYGEPGTGKSSLIKHLICKYQDKEWVFIDGNILAGSSQNKLMTYFLDNPNTIFILEDCEKILVSRDKEFNPVMSVLLNITDSTISDILGIKIICTFNTALSNIDKALLRKGRLSLKYEFKNLSAKKASDILGRQVDKDMPLSDIYYDKEENDFSKKETKKIGF